MQTITADMNSLMHQAPQTAETYLINCRIAIDEQFGEGYAAKHPELLAAMIQASAQDFHTSCLCAVLQDQVGSVSMALENMTASLHGVAQALSEIGDSLDAQGS